MGGGGVRNFATLTLVDSTISGNTARRNGGAIFNNDAGAVDVSQSILEKNSAEVSGGGIWNRGTMTVADSDLFLNTADLDGGGLFNTDGGSLLVTDSTIRENTATSGGGLLNGVQRGRKLVVAGSDVTLVRSTVADNTSVFGSGLANIQSSLGHSQQGIVHSIHVEQSTIRDNSAETWGGGIYNARSEMTLSESTLHDNSAAEAFAGGIYNAASTMALTNSTISGNSVDFGGGGGITNAGGELTIHNSTVTDNHANLEGESPFGTAFDGGGGINQVQFAGATTLHNTIVAGNVVGSEEAPDDIAGSLEPNSSFNLISDAGSAGSLTDGTDGNLVGVDPLLDPLADNGGPTMTHALLSVSPAIDAGRDLAETGIDQRGFLRPIDLHDVSNSAGGDGSDIGAVECQVSQPIQQVGLLIVSVRELAEDGVLLDGQATALTSILETSLRHLQSGKEQVAAKQLEAFIAVVEGYLAGGSLTEEEGQPLIEAAEALIDDDGEDLAALDQVFADFAVSSREELWPKRKPVLQQCLQLLDVILLIFIERLERLQLAVEHLQTGVRWIVIGRVTCPKATSQRLAIRLERYDAKRRVRVTCDLTQPIPLPML